jgi:hypothetical protein
MCFVTASHGSSKLFSVIFVSFLLSMVVLPFLLLWVFYISKKVENLFESFILFSRFSFIWVFFSVEKSGMHISILSPYMLFPLLFYVPSLITIFFMGLIH